MSFESKEYSESGAQPVYLFKITRTGKTWLYTNMDEAITFATEVYAAYPITMPSIIQSGTAQTDDLKLTMPRTVPMAQYLDLLQPSGPLRLTVRRVHLNDTGSVYTPDGEIDAPIVWVGSYASIGRPSPAIRELTFRALALARNGLRLSWSSNCPHMIYDDSCKVLKADFAVPLTGVTVVDGVTIQSDDLLPFVNAYFAGGFIEWESEPGVLETRGIEGNVGDPGPGTIILFGTSRNMDTGDNFVAYPGCARTPFVCKNTFNNMLNYGGINHLNGRSPFDGNPVF